MTWRDWTAGTPMRVALAAIVLAAAAFGWALAGAQHASSVTPAPEGVVVASGALASAAPAPVVNVGAAVAADLFSPTRTAPSVAYVPPGESPASGSAAPAEPPKPVVLGTAIALDGSSFATCQFASSRLLMVRVGDHVGNYIVKSIERGRVVFEAPGGKLLEVLAPRSGS